MDKQKQIEEMAKLVQGDMCGDVHCEECNYHGKMKILPKYCGTYLIAKKLYNAGYRKISENAVVLTREEYEKLNMKYISVLEQLENKGKETAEKFAELLKIEFKEEYFWCDFVAWKIDEICKEITEGKI